MIHQDLTYKIIGAAMEVHQTLGNGFQELLYQRALKVEFETQELGFVREQEQTVYYKNVDIGTRRADFIVENKVIVELKAIINLENVHLAQIKNYLVAYDFDIGLLLNFGAESLQYHRIYHPRLKKV